MTKNGETETETEAAPAGAPERALRTRHLRWGWWSLALFLCMGLALESLHGFKLGFYLDAANDTRRHMWTLSHAHGSLLGLVHIAYAVTLERLREDANLRALSRSLIAAGVLLPLGFFLGGLWFFSGDPGPGILLVPIGGLCLLYAVWGTARSL